MGKLHKEIIQKICERLGHQKNYGKCFHEIAEKLDTILTLPYRKNQILGWLKSKEVLIGVFGEEVVTPCCGFIPDDGDDFFTCDGCAITYPHTIACPYAWQYHHNQLPHTIKECLEYYGRELGC